MEITLSTPSERAAALQDTIISASGWRRCFGGSPESTSGAITPVEQDITILAVDAFLNALGGQQNPVIVVGTDTRPTGPAIAEIVLLTLLAAGAVPRWLGVAPSPQVMAYSGQTPEVSGFFYISASHNPVGYNGFKMGRGDGGVLAGAEAEEVARLFRKCVADQQYLQTRAGAVRHLPREALQEVLSDQPRWHRQSLDVYQRFVLAVAAASGMEEESFTIDLRRGLDARPLGILGDLNGSARCAGPDRSLLPWLGVRAAFINDSPGRIAHQILPEGAGLQEAAEALREHHRRDPAFSVAYVPDNDGDRGNLVFMGPEGEPVLLSAQEVFSLVMLIELSWIRYLGKNDDPLAVVVNGPTSLRVEEIASPLGARIFRAEVGEANVVALGRSLAREGWRVPVVGEGSNGGTILPPAAVRDPMNTLLSLLKLHSLPLMPGHEGISLAEARSLLPVYTTTATDDPLAKMQVPPISQKELKERYEALLQQRFSEIREEVATELGVTTYQILNYEGVETRQGAGNRSGDHAGGLRVLLNGSDGTPRGALWMRGSRTEPIFRVMVDIPGERNELHHRLITWHRELIAQSSGAVNA